MTRLYTRTPLRDRCGLREVWSTRTVLRIELGNYRARWIRYEACNERDEGEKKNKSFHCTLRGRGFRSTGGKGDKGVMVIVSQFRVWYMPYHITPYPGGSVDSFFLSFFSGAKAFIADLYVLVVYIVTDSFCAYRTFLVLVFFSFFLIKIRQCTCTSSTYCENFLGKTERTATDYNKDFGELEYPLPRAQARTVDPTGDEETAWETKCAVK